MKTQLEKEFIGTGEVKGFKFTQIRFSEQATMYKVEQDDNLYHYEVFKTKFTPVCIDFENKVFSETDFKQVYPKSNNFGVWAWTFRELEKAESKFNELQNIESILKQS